MPRWFPTRSPKVIMTVSGFVTLILSSFTPRIFRVLENTEPHQEYGSRHSASETPRLLPRLRFREPRQSRIWSRNEPGVSRLPYFPCYFVCLYSHYRVLTE